MSTASDSRLQPAIARQQLTLRAGRDPENSWRSPRAGVLGVLAVQPLGGRPVSQARVQHRRLGPPRQHRVEHLHAVAAPSELEQVIKRLRRAALCEPQTRARPEDMAHVTDVGQLRTRPRVLQHLLRLLQRAAVDQRERQPRADVGDRERRQTSNRERLPAVGLRVGDASRHVARHLPAPDRRAERQRRASGPAIGDQQVKQLGELGDAIGEQQRIQGLVDGHAVSALVVYEPARRAGAQGDLDSARRVAAEEGSARADAAQHQALGRRAAGGRHERVDPGRCRLHGARMRQAEAAQLGFQRQPQLLIGIDEIVQRLLEHRGGTGDAAVQHRDARQQQPCLGARGRALR